MHKSSQVKMEKKAETKAEPIQEENRVEMEEILESPKIQKPRRKKAGSGKHAKGVAQTLSDALRDLLLVTDNCIYQLMGVYKNIFVLEKQDKADYYKDQGFILFAKKEYEKAIEFFLLYLKNVNSSDPDVLFHLGICFRKSNEHPKAISCFKKAEEQVGDDPDIAFELAICFVELEKHSQAIEYLLKAIPNYPERGELFFMLGTAYEKTNQWDEAFKAYHKAIVLSPRNPLYYHALGFAYETNGQHPQAIEYFKKAMELEKNR